MLNEGEQRTGEAVGVLLSELFEMKLQVRPSAALLGRLTEEGLEKKGVTKDAAGMTLINKHEEVSGNNDGVEE